MYKFFYTQININFIIKYLKNYKHMV